MVADALEGAGIRIRVPCPLYHACTILISLSNPPTVAFCNVATDWRTLHPLFDTHCKSETLISQRAHTRLQRPLQTPQAAIDAFLTPEFRPKAAHNTPFYIQGQPQIDGVAGTAALGSPRLPCPTTFVPARPHAAWRGPWPRMSMSPPQPAGVFSRVAPFRGVRSHGRGAQRGDRNGIQAVSCRVATTGPAPTLIAVPCRRRRRAGYGRYRKRRPRPEPDPDDAGIPKSSSSTSTSRWTNGRTAARTQSASSVPSD